MSSSDDILLLKEHMAKFDITVWHPLKEEERKVIYDSSLSTLIWDNGEQVLPNVSVQPDVVTPAKINHGKRDLKTIKIQLGLSCNFECDYCNQRFVPHADSTNPDDVQPFVDNMSTWYHGGDDGLGAGSHFEFWGGEPLVYWKTLKPLAESILSKYPNATRSIITNGSLLDNTKIDWLEKYDFWVGVSHDGPGQFVRGPDPLEELESKNAIIDLFKRLAPTGKTSFNTMINAKNISRADIEQYFTKFITEQIGEDYVKYLRIGEGGFIDAYDEGGLSSSLLDEEEEIKYRNLALNELRQGKVKRFNSINDKVMQFIASINRGDRIEAIPQKCGMDRSNNIALDLNGNVITCQNVSAVSNNPAGKSHLLGHVSDLESVKLDSSTHWSDREECSKCPVLHICKGACMFLSGELWEASCNNAFSDNIINFTIAIEEMTGGWIPMYIEGPLRQDRKDIYWWVNGKPENTRKAKKVIPIMAV
jgi:uncharacterized protein